MIKLTNNNHEYKNIPTKPNDQFQKNSLESTKIPFKEVRKYPLNAWKNAWKHENKTKRGIKWSYRPWGRKTLQKLRKKTTKNLSVALPSRREGEKVEKTFEKDVWNSQRTIFKKTWNTMFDWSKNRFNQSNQVEAHRIFKTRFQLIEN